MDKITIFTVPRYFKAPFELIQYNAIRSWLLLKPTPEIILCGNDEGVAKAAKELGVKHIPNIKLSGQGTPLINSVFTGVQKVAKHPILAYVNSDIILMNDFLTTIHLVAGIHRHQFVIVGQRWDLDVSRPLDFSDIRWRSKLRKRATSKGKLHSPCGIDYYIFRKKYGNNMPPFIAGRPSWDNWFLSQTLRDGIGVIDATKKIMVVHQNHDYSHAGGVHNARQGREAQLNRKLAGGERVFINNASWKFIRGKLVKKPLLHYLVTWTNIDTGKRGNLTEIQAFDTSDAKRKTEGADKKITHVRFLNTRAFERGAFELTLKRLDGNEEVHSEIYIAFDEKEAEKAWKLLGTSTRDIHKYLCRVTAVKRLPMHKNRVVQ